MSLPKLAVSKYSLKLPSSGQELKFRPFLVKEEKILLMAMQSGSQKDILEGFKEIIRSCVDGDIDDWLENYSDLVVEDIDINFT